MNAKEELTKLIMESYDRGVADAKQEALAELDATNRQVEILSDALAECEQENRLLRARVDRMEREFALERQQLLNENTEIYGLLGMAHLNLKQHLEYGFNTNTATSTLISVGQYAPKLREAMKQGGTHETKTA